MMMIDLFILVIALFALVMCISLILEWLLIAKIAAVIIVILITLLIFISE